METLCFNSWIIIYFSLVSLGHLAFKFSGFLRFISTGLPCANEIKALNADPPRINSAEIKNI